jgi:biopolymer transport protein ExbD
MRLSPTTTKPFDRIVVVNIIDVALVLVVILLFMSPMLTVPDQTVTLPAAEARGSEDDEAISVTVGQDGSLAVGEQKLASLDALQPVLRAHLSERSEQQRLVVLRADARLSEGRVREVMEQIRDAGAARLAVAVRQKGGAAR